MTACAFIRRYFPAWLSDLLCPIRANPDIVGRFRITEGDISPDARTRHAEKIVNARKWMLENGHDAVKPIINSRLKGIAK